MTLHRWVLSCDPFTLATVSWSPQTSEKIHLPPLTPEQEIPLLSSYSLSGKPTTSNAAGFTVVAIEPKDTAVWYYHVGDGASTERGWVRHEYDVGSITLPAINGRSSKQTKKFITRLTVVGGKFYFFQSHDELDVLDFSPGPVFSSVPVPGIERPPRTNIMVLLFIELGGELYLVSDFLHYKVGDTPRVHSCSVYKMDLVGKRWHKVRDIGDRPFIMCPQYFIIRLSMILLKLRDIFSMSCASSSKISL
ncbi:hypothetical protein ZWY2020_029948 [Hordeum vulgare]|nr:hypothetical protein ZWY2020_029948 [Hordeum vulgare]